MLDPVIANDGYTYDNTAIKQYFVNHKTSPITREYMSDLSTFVPNDFLKSRIIEYIHDRINSINNSADNIHSNSTNTNSIIANSMGNGIHNSTGSMGSNKGLSGTPPIFNGSKSTGSLLSYKYGRGSDVVGTSASIHNSNGSNNNSNNKHGLIPPSGPLSPDRVAIGKSPHYTLTNQPYATIPGTTDHSSLHLSDLNLNSMNNMNSSGLLSPHSNTLHRQGSFSQLGLGQGQGQMQGQQQHPGHGAISPQTTRDSQSHSSSFGTLPKGFFGESYVASSYLSQSTPHLSLTSPSLPSSLTPTNQQHQSVHQPLSELDRKGSNLSEISGYRHTDNNAGLSSPHHHHHNILPPQSPHPPHLQPPPHSQLQPLQQPPQQSQPQQQQQHDASAFSLFGAASHDSFDHHLNKISNISNGNISNSNYSSLVSSGHTFTPSLARSQSNESITTSVFYNNNSYNNTSILAAISARFGTNTNTNTNNNNDTDNNTASNDSKNNNTNDNSITQYINDSLYISPSTTADVVDGHSGGVEKWRIKSATPPSPPSLPPLTTTGNSASTTPTDLNRPLSEWLNEIFTGHDLDLINTFSSKFQQDLGFMTISDLIDAYHLKQLNFEFLKENIGLKLGHYNRLINGIKNVIG